MLNTFNVFLQLAVSLALLTAVVLVKLSLNLPKSTSWQDMMRRFRTVEGRLVQLSFCYPLSDGLTCLPNELMLLVTGRKGLWAAFVNAGVLLTVVDSLESDCPIGGKLLSVESIHAEAARARLLLLISILLEPVYDPQKIAYVAFERYLSVVAQTTYLIKDYHPECYPEYIRSVLGAFSEGENSPMALARGAKKKDPNATRHVSQTAAILDHPIASWESVDDQDPLAAVLNHYRPPRLLPESNSQAAASWPGGG